jgi:type II secretory pathway component PulK
LTQYRQGGFVLAVTLWVLAIVAMAAAFFADRMARTVHLAERAQARSLALLDMEATRADILFRMSTTPISIFGLGLDSANAIALDDRAYAGRGDSLVRLQDNRGLLNLNIVNDARLDRFLGVLGVAGAGRTAMIDTLRDYVDDDNLKRLNGAEAADYAEAGLPPPRNAMLVTPFETKNILGWKDVAPLWQDNLLPRLTTTGASFSMNPNTAPWQVLATMRGMTPEAALAIVQARKLAPIASAEQIASLTGIAVSTDMFEPDVIAYPADSMRITQKALDMGWGWQYNVTLTPSGASAPWRIDYFYRIELPPTTDGEQVLQPLPKRSEVGAPVTPGVLPVP